MATNAYVFTGHGNELFTEFEARSKIPDGVTLVTLTECGTPTTVPDIISMIEKMNATPEPFLKLGAAKTEEAQKAIEAQLGRGIRVYRPGMSYPDLQYAPIGDLHPPDKGGKSYTLYLKSGVYTLPISLQVNPEWKIAGSVARHKPTRFTLPPDRNLEFAKYFTITEGYSDDAARKSFAGSIYPTGDQLETILKTKKDNYRDPEKEEDTYIPIGNVFTKLGPGIYYWLICRGSIDGEPKEVVERVQKLRSESTRRQRGVGRRNRRKTYRRKRRY